MADISKVTILNGTTYDLKDEKSRKGLYYGISDTAANTAEKTVAIDGINELTAGLMVAIKFSNANTASSPSLNINSLGTKQIYQYGTTAAAGTASTTGWQAGQVVILIYDGTGWQYNKGYNTNNTYSSMSAAEIAAGTGTTARTISPANLKTAIQTWETTYSNATASNNGLMSSSDKIKLDLMEEIIDAVTSGFEYKGSVSTKNNLPAGASVGDVYTVADEGNNKYAWNGSEWIDISTQRAILG